MDKGQWRFDLLREDSFTRFRHRQLAGKPRNLISVSSSSSSSQSIHKVKEETSSTISIPHLKLMTHSIGKPVFRPEIRKISSLYLSTQFNIIKNKWRIRKKKTKM
ncbi:hypothetical protein L6452_23044 [Arctium lappa]|uniref:Uncharacterized protein n=1 Tax=Arctium lappa TaxID=4217 RepID=A0ACB9B0R0_ARCLA|nr:hypothetical protein L6452_23044 [Arctium lappa]